MFVEAQNNIQIPTHIIGQKLDLHEYYYLTGFDHFSNKGKFNSLTCIAMSYDCLTERYKVEIQGNGLYAGRQYNVMAKNLMPKPKVSVEKKVE